MERSWPHGRAEVMGAEGLDLQGLDDEGKGNFGIANGSDVAGGYKLDEVPAIWEILRVKNSKVREEQNLPVWQRLPTSEDVFRFKKLVQQTMACRKLPALTLALVKDGHVVLRANLGHADPEGRVPVSRSTRFAIGSLTKAFTSTLVSELLLRRNLSLDTPINKLIPESFQLMDEVRTRTVTVRDLLGHRTGVPGYFHALLMGFPAHVTRSELISRLRYLPAVVPLRYQFLYNNYLYTLAAHVVEKLTSRRWEALLRDVILTPLAMRSTGFVDEVKGFEQFALPCALRNGSFRNLMPDLLLSVSPCGPAGSLYSTAHDMARWLQALLSDGRDAKGKQVLQEKALRETTRAVMPPPGIGTDLTKPDFPISDVEQSYGMGWVTSNYRGYEKVWHSGGIVTYSSRLWLLPGVKAGLFVATNGPQTRDKGHALTAITNMAADLLLGEAFWLNETTICTFPAPWKPPQIHDKKERRDSTGGLTTKRQESSDLDLNQLVGVYTNKAFGEIVIERGGGGGGGGGDGLEEYDVREHGDDIFKAGEKGNGSEWLVLKGWDGWFIGPLWYVTDSDEHQRPIRVHFLRDVTGHVEGIRYPIDGHYDDIEFRKQDGQGVTASVPYSATSGGEAAMTAVARLDFGVALLLMAWLCKPLQF
ncbi:uncharacterized protein LOC143298638 [Babylonia areolata]|uniref:uncharacterized protein LOC143298638 n=1 Tax=Babylonia areolata TaxID=304850 RepID=UPI003FD036C0